MPIAKGQGRARGSKVVQDEAVPGAEVRGDLLDQEISFDVLPKPDPSGESSNILVAKSPAERAVIALNSTKAESQLRELVAKSADITAVIDPAGRDQAHRIAMDLKNARVTIKNTGKTAREDAQAFSAAVIAEEKRLIAITEAEEERVFKLRDDYDAKVKAEKEEAERKVRELVAQRRAKIDAIASLPRTLAGASSAQLVEELQKLVAMQPTAEEFDSMLAEMLLTIETVGGALSALLAGAREREEVERKRIEAQEAERARLAKQAEENARIAAELEKQRQEAAAAAKAQADELARLRADMERERAELEALRASMQPSLQPDLQPDPAPEPDRAPLALVPTKGDHEPHFDWSEPPEQLEVVSITLTAVPDFSAMDEQELAPEPAHSPLGAFFDAVRALRQSRTADDVRKHLETVLADVQAEIELGVKGYK